MAAAVPYVTLAEITSADWSLQLGAIGEVVQGLNDVAQCIAIICTTAQGDDPLRPDFAWDLGGVIDLPVTLAIPLIVAGLAAAIEKWEPRVQTLPISAVPINNNAGPASQWEITVKWTLNLAAAMPPQTTVVTVPANS